MKWLSELCKIASEISEIIFEIGEIIFEITDFYKISSLKVKKKVKKSTELTGRTTVDLCRAGRTSLAPCSPRRSLSSCTPERLFSAAMAVRLPIARSSKRIIKSNRLVHG